MRRERNHEEHREFPSGFVLKTEQIWGNWMHYEEEEREVKGGRSYGVSLNVEFLKIISMKSACIHGVNPLSLRGLYCWGRSTSSECFWQISPDTLPNARPPPLLRRGAKSAHSLLCSPPLCTKLLRTVATEELSAVCSHLVNATPAMYACGSFPWGARSPGLNNTVVRVIFLMATYFDNKAKPVLWLSELRRGEAGRVVLQSVCLLLDRQTSFTSSVSLNLSAYSDLRIMWISYQLFYHQPLLLFALVKQIQWKKKKQVLRNCCRSWNDQLLQLRKTVLGTVDTTLVTELLWVMIEWQQEETGSK